MSISTNGLMGTGINSVDYNSYIKQVASNGDQIMSGGITTLMNFMNLYSDLAQSKFDVMNARANRARNSQQAANAIDATISQLTDASSTAAIPSDVLAYLRSNNISISVQNNGNTSSQSIDQYLASIGHTDGAGLNKGQLDTIKAALETDSSQCSDFVSQSQLQIQKTMQSYNVCVSLINSMQTLLAEMNKSIAQNIR